jgi:hypothetical protein
LALKAIVEREEKNIEFLRLPRPPVEQVDVKDFYEWVDPEGKMRRDNEPPLTDEEVIKIFNEIEIEDWKQK